MSAVCSIEPGSDVAARPLKAASAGCTFRLWFGAAFDRGALKIGDEGSTVSGSGEVTADDEEDGAIYAVVVNKEEQYSIWPIHKAMPRGWRPAGKEARKAECLRYIDEVWTDMRPLSLRRTMEAASRQGKPSKKFDSNS